MLAQLPWVRPSLAVSEFLAPDWARDAACKDLDEEEIDAYFFPQRGGSSKAGRALCARCSVTEQCLELALSRGEAFGIWGGTSERQRRVLRRERETPRKRRPPKLCQTAGSCRRPRLVCDALRPRAATQRVCLARFK